MKVLVCLGNPGKEYERTRHNAGFLIADYLKKAWASHPNFTPMGREKDHLYDADEYEWNYDELKAREKIVLLKPMTFMNLSGKAVQHYLKYTTGVTIATDVWVIHDDVDLPLGRMKIDKNASAAGQKGVQNIIDQLSTKDFIRFRIGIAPDGRPKEKAEEFVLKKFSKNEEKIFENVMEEVCEAVSMLLVDGLEKTQTQHNTRQCC